jgi:hypothetical protein
MLEAKKLQKGFLGPIGDDLPSLIPIIVALTIFFATFTNAFQKFDRENATLEDSIKAINIARTLRYGTYIRNYEDFERACAQINERNIIFKAGIVSLEERTPHKPISPFNLDIHKFANESAGVFEEGGNKFECTNMREGDELRKEDSAIVRMYPVAYQDRRVVSGLAVKPKLLVVVVWRHA